MTSLGNARTPKTQQGFAQPERLMPLGFQLGYREHPPLVAAPLPLANPQPIYLDLEELACFEAVDRQFQRQGVTFTNAIALQPSNPAFPVHSGKTVLMGAPHPGLIEAIFHRPTAFVSACVTASRRTVLSAYDPQDRLVAETELPDANLAGGNANLPPNTELCLCAPNIHRVVFSAIGGHLTLNDFGFSG